MIRHGEISIDCVRMVIHHGERHYMLHPNARKRQFPILCHLLLSGGISKDELFHLMWGHRADGGPISGTKLLAVQFTQYREIFKVLGMKLHKERRGEDNVYALVPDDVV